MVKETIKTIDGHFLIRVDQAEIDRRAVEAQRLEMEIEAAKEKETGAIIPESERVDGKKKGIDSLVIAELTDAPRETVFMANEDGQVSPGDEVIIRDDVAPLHIKSGDYIYMMYSERAILMVFSK